VFEQCLLVIYVTVVIPLNLALTTWHMTSMLWFQIISDSVAFIVKFVRVCGPCQPPTMHCTKESRQLRSLESQIVSDLLFCKQTFTRSDFVTSSKESVTRSWHQDIQLAKYLKKTNTYIIRFFLYFARMPSFDGPCFLAPMVIILVWALPVPARLKVLFQTSSDFLCGWKTAHKDVYSKYQ